MLSSTSRTTRRARALHSGSWSALAGPTRHQHRDFRFGPWGSSDLDSDLHHDARRRHRTLRYRYMESLNRKLSWENQPSLDDTKAALKKAMSDVIRSSTILGEGSKPTTVEAGAKSWSDDFSGVRPGRNIEDVERDAIDHLFRSNKPQSKDAGQEPLKSPLHNIRKYLKTQRTPREVTPGEVLHATTSINSQGTKIDPITNRRVPVDGPSALDLSATSFTPKTEDVDIHTNASRQSEGDDFPDDAEKYKPVKWNEPDGLPKPTPEEESKKYDDLGKYRAPSDTKTATEREPAKYDDLGNYKPVRWNEPDGLRKPTSEEESKKYKDLGKYDPATYDDPNAPVKLTPEEESKKYKDLGDYKAVSWNEPNGLRERSSEELSKNYHDLGDYKPVRWNEPDGLQKPTREELTKDYDDLNSYGAVRWNEPDGLRKQTPEEMTKEYEDLDKYGAVRWNEPDGLQKPTAEELTKNYDDLNKYDAVRWNEPDGLQKPTPEELSKSYTDLRDYKPVSWNEPDGLQKSTPEELSKNYEDLEKYDGPRVAKDSTLKAYAATQMDTTQRGEPLPSKVEVACEQPGKEYKDLGEYGPVRWNEPDGLRKMTPEELSKDYQDLHLYGAVKWNEPDGLPVPTPEEESKNYQDVHKYAATEPTEDAPNRLHPEEASKAYRDLHSYGPIRWNEPDGLQKQTPEEASKVYDDLPGYAAGPDNTAARRHPEEISKEYKDLDKYAKFENNAAITRMHPEEASKQYTDLDKYDPRSFDSPIQGYSDLSGATKSASVEEPAKAHSDLARYDPQQFDSTSLPYSLHPEEVTKNYSDRDHYAGAGHPKPDNFSGETKGYSRSDALENSADPLDHLTAHEIRADIVQKARHSVHTPELEESKVEYEKSWDSASTDAQNNLKQHAKPSLPRKLTGNYARDFPEDFSTSWSKDNSPSKQALFPAVQALEDNISNPTPTTTKPPNEEAELSSMDESFPSDTFRPEPALDRQLSGQITDRQARRRALEDDPYSTAPQGLETSYAQECGGVPTWPALVKHYSSPEKASGEILAPSASEEPKLYKLLAYDPATDSIRVAETTSKVLTTTSPLNPAEIVLQLSNPAKFLPHFAPLENQGYEMVSGTGDVLVFHKVREGSTSASDTSYSMPTRTPVNPIDMMGKPPVTGNFASPTGFVNYDNVAEGMDKPAPPFRSDTAESNEEQRVFGAESDRDASGRSSRRQRKTKRGIGRKVVLGVAWTAGIAYAVGVVGEYFATGGTGVKR